MEEEKKEKKSLNFEIKDKKINIIVTAVCLVLMVALTISSAIIFRNFTNYQTEFKFTEGIDAQGATRYTEKFSKYSPKLKGTKGDSTFYVIKGAEEGPSVLVLGGTHPNEPSGQIACTLLMENIKVTKGTYYFVTETNKSAYNHSMPLEASKMYYEIETPSGIRKFKFGSRATNTNEQWPNPDIYVHSSGQKLSSTDTRNINRAYPGSENGTYTERVAYAITQCILQNDITITFDLHEASPEYSTINAMICNSRALSSTGSTLAKALATDAQMWYIDDYFKDLGIENSPENLHGLTHRELGTFTDSLVILCETSNASQGKIRGAFDSDLIVSGKDKFYEYLVEYDKTHGDKLIYGEPVELSVRVARHVECILAVLSEYNDDYLTFDFGTSILTGEERNTKLHALGEFGFSNIPDYNEICANGVGYYL